MSVLLRDGPEDSALRFVFAHGAGAPMDSPFMNTIAKGVAAAGIEVVRFEFEYMAKAREDGRRRGPDRAPKLIARFEEVLAQLPGTRATVVGGKSMGGRIASLVAEDAGAAGLVCLGYPFHPPGRPERLRTEHLAHLSVPTLICQGTRDPFGTPREVKTYTLSSKIELFWLEDGDHSFKPRKKSGLTQEQHLRATVETITSFVASLR